MTINSERLQLHFEAMSAIGKLGETGTCRPTLTKTEMQAFELASSWMMEAGMTTRIDNFGNLIGTLVGSDPKLPLVMLGSHLDSQPYGGRFDGVAGVLCAIEAVAALKEKGIAPARTIEVVSFADEEGWRFNKGLFGSRGILGRLEEGELDRKDSDGISRREALLAFGCDPEKFSDSEYAPGSIHCFLELHIEQGPILDMQQKPVGVVSGISGPLWLTVNLKGMAGHAGSVPMPIRQDALVAAAEIIVALRRIATQITDAPTVGTVGTLQVFPASRNIIPEEVTFTVDLRDIDLQRRNTYEAQLRAEIEQVCTKHRLTSTITQDWNSEPRYCATWLKDIIHRQCVNMNLHAPELMSGPFHDAMALSYATDYAMIFVRCKDGISHNPLEFASYEDLSTGAEVLYRTLEEVLNT